MYFIACLKNEFYGIDLPIEKKTMALEKRLIENFCITVRGRFFYTQAICLENTTRKMK